MTQKICILADVYYPQNITDAQIAARVKPTTEEVAIASENIHRIRNLAATLEYTYHVPNGVTPIGTRTGLYFGLDLVLTEFYFKRGAELVLSDNATFDDISAYSIDQQRTILSTVKRWLEHCYRCGLDIPPVIKSYYPQRGVNADTINILQDLGIENVAFTSSEFSKSMPVNAVYGRDDMLAVLNTDEDIILYVNTLDLPQCKNNDTDVRYPTDMLPFFDAAIAKGAVFCKFSDM